MEEQMTEILLFIRQTVYCGQSQLTSAQLAKHFGYDAYYFSRKFKEINGFSVSELISSLKIEKAVLDLDQMKKVMELQNLAHYESSGSFSSIFKKFTGSSPKNYQKNLEDITQEVQQFEGENKENNISHYESKAESSCQITLRFPDNSKPSLTFVGLFDRPIPNHKPIVGVAKKGKEQIRLENIPSGEFYLLACSVSQTRHPLRYFNFSHALRGMVEHKLCFPEDNQKHYTLDLRDPLPQDPPILYNFARLLYPYLKKSI